MGAYGLRKSTKHVWLLFYMKSDFVISGEFHVPVSASSSIRPSDALREAGDFISLVNAHVRDKDGNEHKAGFIQIARDAIAWVEFPPEDLPWKERLPPRG
jgi:hypothetical protein